MPRVFTIYNCGTAFSRDNKDETIANLAGRTVGAENRDWMINAGPGSKTTKTSRTPGTGPSTSRFTGFFKRMGGLVGGYGWEQNVEHTLAVVDALLVGSKQQITTINLAGWSRGGITCFMIAHGLHELDLAKNIPVNIFAFDPVPGPGNFDDPKKTTLAPNVQHYTAVMQEDESRYIMKPVPLPDNEQGPGQTRVFYPMPGGHSGGVKRQKTDAGLVASFLAHEFLTQHGTQLENPIRLSSRDLCELYGNMRLDLVRKAKKKKKQFFRKLAKSRKGIINEFRDNVYFINWHHAEQFRKTFPVVWLAFEMGIHEFNRQAFANALRQMSIQAPTTYKSLVESGIVE